MKNENAFQRTNALGAASPRDHLYFTSMTTTQRDSAVRNMVWGYENEALLLSELIGLIRGKFGETAQNLFTNTLTKGLEQPNSTRLISFASVCALYSNWDTLEQVTTAAMDGTVKLAGEPVAVSVSDWLDKLASRSGIDVYYTGATNYNIHVRSTKFVFDLYRMAAQFGPDRARSLFDIALRHQPDHPSIAKVMEAGGSSGAVLAEVLMERKIASIDIRPAAVQPVDIGRRRRSAM